MLRSMTGFGRCTIESGAWTQVWEIRSVNHRHLDIRWKMPYFVRSLEPIFEKAVKRISTRGRVDIFLTMQAASGTAQRADFNAEKAGAMLDALTAFAASRGQSFTPDYQAMMSISSLWEEGLSEPDEALCSDLLGGLKAALADWDTSRREEGAMLRRDLHERFALMQSWVESIKKRAPAIKEERFVQVRTRVAEVLEHFKQELDEGRFLQEITLLADKLDVSEELTRLQAHFARLDALLDQGKEAGRKLDFTLQECFREVATCGNKIQDIQVSHMVVDLKNELEKCREQVQNVE